MLKRIIESITYMQNQGVRKKDMIVVIDKEKMVEEIKRLNLNIEFDYNAKKIYGVDCDYRKLQKSVLYHVLTKDDYKLLRQVKLPQESKTVKVPELKMADIANDIASDYESQKNKDLMKFLKSKGYRPQNTPEYIKGLKRRLKKKGLELICEEVQNQAEFKNNTMHYSVAYTFDIRKIDETQAN